MELHGCAGYGFDRGLVKLAGKLSISQLPLPDGKLMGPQQNLPTIGFVQMASLRRQAGKKA